jgi:nucleotide-binding universal stress UspA family protein
MAPGSARRRIVVGVDGSLPSLHALRWAAGEARRRDADICTVTVDADALSEYAPYVPASTRIPREERWAGLARTLADTIIKALGPCPNLQIHEHVEEGRPGEVLARYGEGAELLVLGARMRDSGHDSSLGPTVQACLRRAGCPVIVVSHDEDPFDSGPSPGHLSDASGVTSKA